MNLRQAIKASLSDDADMVREGLRWIGQNAEAGKEGTSELCKRLLGSFNQPKTKTVKFKMSDLDKAYANAEANQMLDLDLITKGDKLEVRVSQTLEELCIWKIMHDTWCDPHAFWVDIVDIYPLSREEAYDQIERWIKAKGFKKAEKKAHSLIDNYDIRDL